MQTFCCGPDVHPGSLLRLIEYGLVRVYDVHNRAANFRASPSPFILESLMALPHASSGQLIDIRPLGSQLTSAPSRAILKTPSLELMRMVLPAGRTVSEHRVPGECTIQCIEGSVELRSHGKTETMRAGDLVYLEGGIVHALHAQQDASLLVTILIRHED